VTPPKGKKGTSKAQGGARKPKKKNPRRKPSSGAKNRKPKKRVNITIAQYNKLQDGYFEKQDIRHAARVAGVHHSTARRYILGEAAPELGMLPINERWLHIQAEAQEEVEFSWKEYATESLRHLKVVSQMHFKELELLKDDLVRRRKKYDDEMSAYREKVAEAEETGSPIPEMPMNLKQLVESYDRLARLMSFLAGGPDSRPDDGRGEFADWTVEELREYWKKGIQPERLRVSK